MCVVYLFRFARRKRKQQRKYIVAMVTALPSCDVMRYGPRVTVRGLDCAVVQLQMYTAEKDVITSKTQ